MNNSHDTKKESVSGEWTGKEGRQYRSVKFWVGAGWTAGFLQVKTADGWVFI